MKIKGIIYLTGKTTIISVFGEEPWNTFIPKLAAKDNFYSNTIWSVTSIPMEKFILFLDEMIKEFFHSDMMQCVTFGKKTAAKQVRGISSGHSDIYFQFELKDS
jgi:hypothetical protein